MSPREGGASGGHRDFSLGSGLLVDKPEGLTSHDVVDQLRRRLSVRKCGHTGTLDPFATGLLVLCLGRATRLARFVSVLPKSYDATIRFGFATDTYDRTGTPVEADSGRSPSEAELAAALARLIGPMRQTPPPFSAKKIAGRRAYALARSGEAVTPEPVAVEVYAIALRELFPPMARIHVRVSSGTYVRSLAHDLGSALGMGAHLDALRRMAVGSLRVESAMSLDALSELAEGSGWREGLLSADELLSHLPSVHVDEAEARALGHGRGAPATEREGLGPYRVAGPSGELVAICETVNGARRPLVVWTPGGNP